MNTFTPLSQGRGQAGQGWGAEYPSGFCIIPPCKILKIPNARCPIPENTQLKKDFIDFKRRELCGGGGFGKNCDSKNQNLFIFIPVYMLTHPPCTLISNGAGRLEKTGVYLLGRKEGRKEGSRLTYSKFIN